MRKKIIALIIVFTLSALHALSAKNYTDAERAQVCREINDSAKVEYKRMGIEPSVLTLRVMYDANTDRMLLYYSGTMLRNSTVENLRTSWITRMKSDGLASMKGMGFSGFTFYANGKSCRYDL